MDVDVDVDNFLTFCNKVLNPCNNGSKILL